MELLSQILELLGYQQESPLLFSSGLFLFLFTGFSLFYYLLRNRMTARIIYVTLFSIYFYYKCSGYYVLLLLIVTTSDYLLARWMEQTSHDSRRKWAVVVSVLLNLSLLGYFKYTNMLVGIYDSIIGNNFEPLSIFLPIGISFFIFQSLSYTIDVYRRDLPAVRHWIDYAFYISFFPMLVAGPIIRAGEFIPQIRQKIHLSQTMLAQGLFMILCGLIKKSIISDYIGINFVDRIFDDPTLYSGFENLMGIYGYGLQIYCDFSGYSDMAIGIALLLGFRVSLNFDSPYKSASITEFWRRWHISLSGWLRDYLYISMGGNRRGSLRTYIHLMVTMLIGGLWHGASVKFILWGGFHGLWLVIEKGVCHLSPSFKLIGSQMGFWSRALRVLLTFHLVLLGWIFFRASSVEIGVSMLQQIFTQFNGQIMMQFAAGYPMVCILMAVGYLLHITPKSITQRARDGFAQAPFLVQTLCFVVICWIIFQIQSSEVQPFIYFQF